MDPPLQVAAVWTLGTLHRDLSRSRPCVHSDWRNDWFFAHLNRQEKTAFSMYILVVAGKI
jgi:hypothetical protein